ncbi:MAG: hypothetical protein ILM98_13270 [Kiritimatiellae bacterium]|nr:hypothetical protein [Kiritimatiellia bacterium]
MRHRRFLSEFKEKRLAGEEAWADDLLGRWREALTPKAVVVVGEDGPEERLGLIDDYRETSPVSTFSSIFFGAF